MRVAPILALTAATLAAAPPARAAFPESPPNDPLFDANPAPNATNEQWDLAAPAEGFDRGISVPPAWRLSTGRGVAIADIDVGVELDHSDLAGQWFLNQGEVPGNRVDDDGNGFVDDTRGFDFFGFDPDTTSDTRNNHGTNVAGVLGAATDNGRGVAGVAPGGAVLPVRTADNILHQASRLAEGIVYSADRGAGVVSMSLGAEAYTRPLRRAAGYADRRGAVLVAAMGNEFHFHHEFPATLDEVIAVGGINPDSANTTALQDAAAAAATDFTVHASYSNYGPHIDVVAPTQVPTTEWGGGYKLNWSGTSAATPHVAGVAALVLARGRQFGLTLRPGEVRQIIRQTADDLSASSKGYGPGWDRLSGWGRVNARRAVERVGAGRIPPDVDIDSPSWYAPLRQDGVAVRGKVLGRSASRWTLELGRGEEPQRWRTVASGRASGSRGRRHRRRRARRLALIDMDSLESGGWTLRLRAEDSRGNTGEDRGFFFAMGDRTLKRGFPTSLGNSGEASPVLADLNRDGAAEIVVAEGSGWVRAIDARTGDELDGWPRRMDEAGAAPIRRRIGPYRKGFAGTPVVGNLVGGRKPEVVAAGLDGRVYAWHANGRRVKRFPVRIDLRAPSPEGRLDGAIYASPALADLNGDRRLDIVVGAADQKVYAWTGGGRRLPGWPVLARDGQGGDVAKILSSPAVGDLNGDGSPEVVEGTAEAYGTTPSTSGRVYAFSARGKLLPGWPVKPEALAADSIPLVGEGVPVTPTLADVDGDGRDEVAVAAFTGQPELYRGDGSRVPGPGSSANHFETTGTGSASQSQAPSALGIGANAAFGRTARGGPLRFFSGLVDSRLASAQLSPATKMPFEHVVGGWDARSGNWLPAFPRTVEGWTIVASPVVADVDGDGHSEVVAGSSGYELHAFREGGGEPPGWPKQTGGWMLATPTVGDVDGDRRLEVVAMTREGHLFVWDTPAPARPGPEWPSFKHDNRGTARYSGR